MEDSIIIEQEIKEREIILDKARKGLKISTEERLWLMTHDLYNLRYDTLAYNVAVEHIKPKTWYTLKIIVESVSYDKRIIPMIYVPGKKDKIVFSGQLFDIDEKSTEKKTVRMLGFMIDKSKIHEVRCFSELGLFSVEYQCEYINTKQNLYIRESSATGNPNYAMIRQVIDDHSVRYYCKSPDKDSFDALVFTIQWEENTLKNKEN